MTTRVLIDAVNVRATGPLALVRALVPALIAHPDLTCTGLIPEGPLEQLDWPHGVEVVPARIAGWSNRIARIRDVLWRVSATARRHDASVTLSLGDIGPLFGSRPAVLFLHNALLVAGDGGASLAISRSLFRRSAARASRILVQSPVMEQALRRTRGHTRGHVEVIPHPSPLVGRGGSAAPALVADQGVCRLLYLGAFYAHKRHDLLPAIVNVLRARGIAARVRIYVTIAETPESATLLALLASSGDVVVNLGALTGADAAATLRAADGLLHLSDAESYGMTLIEALRADRELVVPDLPYSRWLCGTAARYFVSGNAEAAAAAIESLLRDGTSVEASAARRQAVSKLIPTWEETARHFARALQEAAGGQ